MIAEIIWYHAITINLFFITLIATFAIPLLYIQRLNQLVRFTRIAGVINYSLLVMIAFDGFVAMVMSGRDWSINMILMVIAFFLLIFAEAIKGYKLKHYILSEDRDPKAFQIRYIAIIVAQLLITLSFILLYN
ncbi:MAG: hypothetical protein U9N49_08740 [Campylobacterota bacterium]|nr:hypothetical protein [Campylobacterota bacterium]